MRASSPTPVDEVVGVFDLEEPFLQLADGDDWPEHFGAARLGVP